MKLIDENTKTAITSMVWFLAEWMHTGKLPEDFDSFEENFHHLRCAAENQHMEEEDQRTRRALKKRR